MASDAGAYPSSLTDAEWELVKALADADPGVVSAAIGAARRAKLSDARAVLEALSTGPNPSLRMDARRALAP